MPSQRGANNVEMIKWTPNQRKNDTEQLLISIGVFLGGIECFSYYYSNISVLHKLLKNTVKIYFDDSTTQEEIDKVYNLDNYGRMPLLLEKIKIK